MTSFEWFDRIGRPLLRIACIGIVLAIGSAIAFAFWRSATTGAPVPDMTGGLTSVITALIPLAIDQITRSSERRAQIQQGNAPGPFGSSPPSPSEDGSDVNGPRPAENRA